MPHGQVDKERKFLNDLTVRLLSTGEWAVEKPEHDENADLIVRDVHSGKKTYIEFQDSGSYGQLPIATILPLNKQKSKLTPGDNLILVTFSIIPELLARKLEEAGIMAVAKPTSIDDVVGKVQVAMAG